MLAIARLRRGARTAWDRHGVSEFCAISAYDCARQYRERPAAKAGGNDAASRVEAISRLLKIEHVLDHVPRELSNGQKQRNALARALIGNPDVLLLKYRLSNVDHKLCYEMRL